MKFMKFMKFMKVAIVSFGHIDSIISIAKYTSIYSDITLFLIFSQFSKSTSIVSFDDVKVENGFVKDEIVKNEILTDQIKEYVGAEFKIKVFVYDNLKLRSIKNFILSNSLVNTLKKYDIIHINGQHGVLPQLQLLLLGKKVVYTIHDFIGHSGERKRFPELMNKWTLYLGSQIILQNTETYNEVIKKFPSVRNKIHFIPFGPLEIYTKFGNQNLKTHKNTIILFGRISPYKGIEYLVEAAKLVRNTIPNLKVIIAGSGRFYFDIEPIRGNNTFRIINRYISNNELADLIRESEIVVCSYTDATQSGVVMTAYAFNKPVIASAVGGFLDAVKHNKTGLLVPPRDSKALAEAIIKLLKNPDKLKEMSNNISNLSKDSEFSWESIAKKTAAVYKMALGKKE